MGEDCKKTREDLEAYALGALEGREARRVERHVGGCRDCAAVVHAYRVVVDELPLAVPVYRPGPRLRQIVLGGVGALRPVVTPTTLLQSSRWWAAAAVVFLAFAIGAIAWAVSLQAKVEQLETDNQQLVDLTHLSEAQRSAILRFQSELFSTQSELYSTRTEQERMVRAQEEQQTLIVLALDPELQPTDLDGTEMAPLANCRYVWSAKQNLGALTCTDLPSTNGYAYNLWLQRGNELINGGSFTRKEDGTAQHLVKVPQPLDEGYGAAIEEMRVTLEPNSTVLAPSEDLVLVSQPAASASR